MNSCFAPIDKTPRSDSPPAKIPLFTKSSFGSGVGSGVGSGGGSGGGSVSSTSVNNYNNSIKRPSEDENIYPPSKRCCY